MFPKTEVELDNLLTKPRPALVEFIGGLSSPLVVLGAGGKMGPGLCVLAQRAAREAGCQLEVVAASRFRDSKVRGWMERQGITALPLDLMERSSWVKLPEAKNAIYMAGVKFGTSQNPAITWVTNTLLPAYACERYPQARIAALSSGNVYPLTPVSGEGAREDAPLSPLGEYANSVIARERIFEYFSGQNGTPVALVRLSYALDLRYGVLADLAWRVWQGEPVDLSNGYVQCIWQADANEMILRSLSLATSPPFAINLTSPQRLSVRQTALTFGKLMGRQVHFCGSEAHDALLSDTRRMVSHLGEPPTPLDEVIAWTAAWVMSGGRTLGKPTHFETRDGRY